MKSCFLALPLLFLSITGLQAADAPKSSRPNVLIILADDKY